MTDLIIKNKQEDILVKDCCDFIPLQDGTISGERKYCNRSLQCTQVDMASDYVQIMGVDGTILEYDYLCTGKHAVPEEISKDEEAE